MNILVFSTVFFPAIGGIENHTLSLVKEFLKKGHTVVVITEQKQEAPLENIKVYHSPGLLTTIKLFNWCNVFYMPNISLKGVWLLCINPFKKWVISHNDFHFVARKNLKSRLKRLIIKFASNNIAVSKSVANHIQTKSAVIYNCYDDEIFKIYDDEERVYDFVFVGRLVSQKGCEMLIKACTSLKQSYTLSIIGDGPELPRLKEMIKKPGNDNQIHFLGFLQNEELARTLNRHRIMIIPSMDREGFGIVALEGLACGCKVIAADAGGLTEAVNRFGKTFEMGSTRELAVLLEDGLLDKSGLPNSSELSEYLHQHTRTAVAGKYLSVFNQIHKAATSCAQAS